MATDFQLPDVQGTVNNIRAGNTKLLADQTAQSGDFLNRYKGALGGQETTSAMASRLGSELGLPNLSKNAFTLNQAVTNLPQTLKDTTRGFDVNQSQLNSLTNNKLSKLVPLAQNATAQLQNAQGSLNTQMGYEQQDQAKALLPFQTEQSMLNDRLARETTLYSQSNEQELNALLQKMSAGVTLSEGEKNRAQQLAMSEKTYGLEKEKLDQQKQQANQTITANGQTYLINPQTGQVISKYGTATPSAASTQVVQQGNQSYLIDSRTGKVISTYGAPSDPNTYYGGGTAPVAQPTPGFKPLK